MRLSEVTKRLGRMGGVVDAYLITHPEVREYLPVTFQLVVIPLDDPEALTWVMENPPSDPSGPAVYAIVRGEGLEALLTPTGPLTVTSQAA